MTQIRLRPVVKGRNRKVPSVEQLSTSAWHFAHATLWREEHFYPKEVKGIKEQIGDYFRSSADPESAFKAFCERVLLASKYVEGTCPRFVPHPAIWFNKNYKFGFAGTRASYLSVQVTRELIPGYHEGMRLFAWYYWRYTVKPSCKVFTICRKKLLHLKEHSMIQCFYYSIIYSQFFHPNK